MSFENNPTSAYRCCVYNTKYTTKVFQLFSQHLIEYIHESSEEKLQNFLKNPECLEVIQEHTYEVLEIIVMILNEEHEIHYKKVNDVCGKVMIFLATHCPANELILYIAEQIELSIIKAHFHLLFQSLQLCLLRCKNPLKMLEMCVNTIVKFLINLPLPNHELGKTRNDDVMEEIVLSYVNVINFIDIIYRDTVLSHKIFTDNTAVDVKQYTFKLLITIFDKTFDCMDISNDNCGFIFQKVVNILHNEIDLIYLIHLKVNNKINTCTGSEIDEHIKKDCAYPLINMNYVQLCNMSWVIFFSDKKVDFIPCVYNPIYIIFCIIQLSNYVICEQPNQYIIISRVLNLVDFALNINQVSIPMEYIDSIVHDKFMQNIINLVVSNDSIKVQKYIINTFIQYINKFEIKAKYRILQKLVTFKCHMKIIGIAIGIFKDTVAQSYFQEPIDDIFRLFFDNSLQDIISKICCLKDGANTDIIKMSDQIIPTLNFMIYFIIRKKENNEVVQMLCKSNYTFLKLLNQLVKDQLGEWKKYLNYVAADSSDNQDCIKNLQHSMTTMSVMPKSQQIFMCHQATNTLLIIQNLIYRICELTNYAALEDNLIEPVLQH